MGMLKHESNSHKRLRIGPQALSTARAAADVQYALDGWDLTYHPNDADLRYLRENIIARILAVLKSGLFMVSIWGTYVSRV